MSDKVIRVSVYEDNDDLREGLSRLINAFPATCSLAGAHQNANHVEADLDEEKPDVVLMDINLPGTSGIQAVKLIYRKDPQVKVLMQTVFNEEDKIFSSICNGAVGYLLKNTPPEEIMNSIRVAYEGGAPMSPGIAAKVLSMFRHHVSPAAPPDYNLSEREGQILFLLTEGLSYKMIAARCEISIDTVRFHIKKIYEKLHVHSMAEAVSKALKDRLV